MPARNLTYDIVIVGSGAGGGTVAQELSPLCRQGDLGNIEALLPCNACQISADHKRITAHACTYVTGYIGSSGLSLAAIFGRGLYRLFDGRPLCCLLGCQTVQPTKHVSHMEERLTVTCPWLPQHH